MRAVLAALVILVLAVAGIFLGQALLNPATENTLESPVVSPTGLFGGADDDGVYNISARVVKDTEGPDVVMKFISEHSGDEVSGASEDTIPLTLEGFVCDPYVFAFPGYVEGVGLLRGAEVSIRVGGTEVATRVLDYNTGSFEVRNFEELIGDGVGPWEVEAVVEDALGNPSVVGVGELSVKDNEYKTKTLKLNTGTHCTQKIGTFLGDKQCKVLERAFSAVTEKNPELCIGRTDDCWWHGHNDCESTEPAKFLITDNEGIETSAGNSKRYCCDEWKKDNSPCRPGGSNCETIEYTGTISYLYLKALTSGGTCRDCLRSSSLKVQYRLFEFAMDNGDDDLECGSIPAPGSECSETKKCSSYDAAECEFVVQGFPSRVFRFPRCSGEGEILQEFAEAKDVGDCFGEQCLCLTETDCADDGKECVGAEGEAECVESLPDCDDACIDINYDGGACGDENDFPQCDTPITRMVNPFPLTTDADCGDEDCICYELGDCDFSSQECNPSTGNCMDIDLCETDTDCVGKCGSLNCECCEEGTLGEGHCVDATVPGVLCEADIWGGQDDSCTDINLEQTQKDLKWERDIGDGSSGMGDSENTAQSFTLSGDGIIDTLEVYLGGFGNSQNPDEYTVNLGISEDLTSDHSEWLDYVSVVVTKGSKEWESITFDPALELSAGTYYIMIEPEDIASPGSKELEVYHGKSSGDGPYSDGEMTGCDEYGQDCTTPSLWNCGLIECDERDMAFKLSGTCP